MASVEIERAKAQAMAEAMAMAEAEGGGMSTLEDVGRTIPSRLRKGTEQLVGTPGDISSLSGTLASWIAGKLGVGPEGQEAAGSVGKGVVSGLFGSPGGLPTTKDIRSITDPAVAATGTEGVLAHEPQGTTAEYLGTMAEFLPAAIAGPGGLMRKVAMDVIPAAASETAGQVARKVAPEYEPYARAGGAILGAGPAALLTPARSAGATVNRAVDGVTPQTLEAAERLFMEAQRAGVPITRFEAIQHVTNGGTRAGDIQRVIEGQGGLRDFMAARPGQVEQTARGQFDQVAPVPASPSTIGPAVGTAAEDTVNQVRGRINTETQPLYDAAAQTPPVSGIGPPVPQRMDPAIMARIQAAPGWEEARNAIRNDPQLARYVAGLPDDSIGFLNEVQKYLRAQAENAAGPVNAQRNMQRSAGYGVDANTVENAVTVQSPELAQAIATQAELRTRYLDPLLQGPLGKIASKDTTTQQAIDALFPRNPLPNSADEIGRSVRTLSRQNPWAARQLVRAHIESTFNQATRELQGGANQWGGPGFVASVRGNPQQAANLEASVRALPGGDDLWTGLDRYMTILEAQGTRQRIGSQTAFNTEALQNLKQGTPLGTAAGVAAGGGLAWPRKALDIAERWRMGRNVNQIADLIVDPQAGRAFRQLATAKGNGARNIAVSLTLMGNAGARSTQPPQGVR